MKGSLTIRGSEIQTRTGLVNQQELRFYPENPRIYSVLRSEGENPSQEEIQERLLKRDHVKHLVQDIILNEGLTDPLIVLDKTFVVLEGNSRLAAYRALAEKDPIKWGKVKCTLLPSDTDEKLLFALLGQYHLKGKKDWVPYEQAGFLYRRYKDHGIPASTLAKEVGIGARKVRQDIKTYQFMLDHGENQLDRWSYYDEYLKSRRIKKLRDDHADFDEVVVAKIKSGEIRKAVEIRNELPLLERATKRTVKKFLAGRFNLSEAIEAVEESGNTNLTYKKLGKFRQWLAREATRESVLVASGQARNKLGFELGKLARIAKQLQERIKDKAQT